MEKHADDFLPFLIADDTGVYDETSYQKYCDKVRSSAEWGGQLEVYELVIFLKFHVIIMNAFCHDLLLLLFSLNLFRVTITSHSYSCKPFPKL
jgi:hypothetical protein